MVTVEEIRAVASELPRTNEGLVRGNVKFRVGRIVYLAISRDGSTMGFAFPKDWRNALVESEPEKFSLPSEHDMRYHWVHVDLDKIDADEMRELVEDAWAFTVPKRVADEYAAAAGLPLISRGAVRVETLRELLRPAEGRAVSGLDLVGSEAEPLSHHPA